MAGHYDIIFVNDNRLLEAELLDRIGNRLNCTVVEARVLLIRMDLREFHHLNLHKGSFPGKMICKSKIRSYFCKS